MPHKRNPIASEQLCGLARVLRGNAQAGLEDVALWHERDISHSSAERIVLPDSTILLDYMLHRATALVEGLAVDAARMRANLDLTHGALFSSALLLALVRAGMGRDEAYRIVQRASLKALSADVPLRELITEEPAIRRLREGASEASELDELFDPRHYVRHADEVLARLDALG
jgi:adenylosuccinate lyase